MEIFPIFCELNKELIILILLSEKLLFGGESPLTMRYGLRADNPHPLGPSTGTA